MKTIKSIQWRAKKDALRKILYEMEHYIEDEIKMLEVWIKDEENCTTPELGGLPDEVE